MTHTDVDLVALEWMKHGDVMSRRQKTMEEKELERPSASFEEAKYRWDQSKTK